MSDHNQRETVRLLEELVCIGKKNEHYLRIIAKEVAPPQLTEIKIQFSKGTAMATPTPGPVTLTAVGQSVTASVVGFDQFGNLFTGTIPTPTFASDDTAGAIVTFDPATGLVTAVANGVANISAFVTTIDAAGNPLTLTDSEAVTVAIPVVAPVLSSIKVAFA